MSTPTIKLLKSLEAKGAKICGDLSFSKGDLYLKDGTAARSMVDEVEFVEVISASDYPMLLDVAIEARATVILADAILARIDAVETFVESEIGAAPAGEDALNNQRLEQALAIDLARAPADQLSPAAFGSQQQLGSYYMTVKTMIPTDDISMSLAAFDYAVPGDAYPMVYIASWNLGLEQSTASRSEFRMDSDWASGGVWSGAVDDGQGNMIFRGADRTYLEQDGVEQFPDYANRDVSLYGVRPAAAETGLGLDRTRSNEYTLDLIKQQVTLIKERFQSNHDRSIAAINKLTGASDADIEAVLAAGHSAPSADVVLTSADTEARHFDLSSIELPELHSLDDLNNPIGYADVDDLRDQPEGFDQVKLPELNATVGAYHGYPITGASPLLDAAFIVTSKLRVKNKAGEVELRAIEGLDSLMGAADTSNVESIQDLLAQISDLKRIAHEAIIDEQGARLEDVECLETSMSAFASNFIEALTTYEAALTEHVSVSMQRMVDYAEGIIEDTVVDRWAQVHEADRAAASFSYSDFVGATHPDSVRVLIDLDGYASHTQRSINDQDREDVSNWIIKTYIEHTDSSSNEVIRNERIWSQAYVDTMDVNGVDKKVLAVDIRTADCDEVYNGDQVTVLAVYTGELDYAKEHDHEFVPHELNCDASILPTLKSSFDSDSPCGDSIVETVPELQECEQVIADWTLYNFVTDVYILRLTGLESAVIDDLTAVVNNAETFHVSLVDGGSWEAPSVSHITDSEGNVIGIDIFVTETFFNDNGGEFASGKAGVKYDPEDAVAAWSTPLTAAHPDGVTASWDASHLLSEIYLHAHDSYGDGFNGGLVKAVLLDDQATEIAEQSWNLGSGEQQDGAVRLFADQTLPEAGSVEITVDPDGNFPSEIEVALGRTPFPYAALEEVVAVLGCTDQYSYNYNPAADTDDGSCFQNYGMVDSGLPGFDPSNSEQDEQDMEIELGNLAANQRAFTLRFGQGAQYMDSENPVDYLDSISMAYADQFTVIVEDDVQLGHVDPGPGVILENPSDSCGPPYIARYGSVGLTTDIMNTYEQRPQFAVLEHSVVLTEGQVTRIRYGKSTGWADYTVELMARVLVDMTSEGKGLSAEAESIGFREPTDFRTDGWESNGGPSAGYKPLQAAMQECLSEFDMDEMTVELRDVDGVYTIIEHTDSGESVLWQEPQMAPDEVFLGEDFNESGSYVAGEGIGMDAFGPLANGASDWMMYAADLSDEGLNPTIRVALTARITGESDTFVVTQLDGYVSSDGYGIDFANGPTPSSYLDIAASIFNMMVDEGVIPSGAGFSNGDLDSVASFGDIVDIISNKVGSELDQYGWIITEVPEEES